MTEAPTWTPIQLTYVLGHFLRSSHVALCLGSFSLARRFPSGRWADSTAHRFSTVAEANAQLGTQLLKAQGMRHTL